MESLDTGKDKIRKICDILKNETLQPAQKEASKIVETAEQQARTIIKEAEVRGAEIVSTSKSKMEKEREVFDTAIQQACRYVIESLKQDIQNKLFNIGLSDWLESETADEKVAAKLINTLVHAIEKEGTSAQFSALIPEQVSAEKVNALLLKKVLNKLREQSVVVGDFMGGVQLKLHDKQLTLDLSDEAIKELLEPYLRKSFRDLLFQA